MSQLKIGISGMSCGHCVGAVKRALESVDGVKVEQVAIGSAVVDFDPAVTSPARIAQAVSDEGYAVVSQTA